MKLSKEVKVGLFSALGIGLLLMGLSYLRGKSIFERFKYYKVVYQNVDGLLENSKVLLGGYQVGTVTLVKMNPETGAINVEFEVSNQLAIPKDSKAMIVTLDLLGNKGIKLLLGKAPVLAESGATLQDTLELGMLQNVYNQLIPLKDKIGFILDEVHSIAKSVRETLQDSASRVNTIAQNIETTSQNFVTISKNIIPLTHRINQLSDTITYLVSDIKKSTPKLNSILDNTQAITQSFQQTANSFPSLMNQTQSAVNSLQLALNKVEKGEGSAGKLINDPLLYNNLVRASQSLDSLLLDLKKNPKRYVHFSVFGRKDKK
jgi:phospholipid/cholesterol/gamma-HCH transport system substrate-binding protein